jgi:hypothetical protein
MRIMVNHDGTGSRFIVLSLPRCGSTTLATVLSLHKDISCLIEPFHPGRYHGRFHELAKRYSPDSILDMIWTRWSGIKHVWEANGFPFIEQPMLNNQIILGPNRKIILIIRRNLLRRFISNHICRQTHFWIGTQAEFRARLQNTEFKPLNPNAVLRQIKRDQEALAGCLQLLSNHNTQFVTLFYEDIFGEQAHAEQQLQIVNSMVEFLNFTPISSDIFSSQWQHHFDPEVNKWASTDVYQRIPKIAEIEAEVGSNETGWLFQ